MRLQMYITVFMLLPCVEFWIHVCSPPLIVMVIKVSYNSTIRDLGSFGDATPGKPGAQEVPAPGKPVFGFKGLNGLWGTYCVNTQNNILSEEFIWFNGDCSTTKWFSTFQDLYVFRCFSCPAGGVILRICLSLGGSYLECVGCRGVISQIPNTRKKTPAPPVHK